MTTEYPIATLFDNPVLDLADHSQVETFVRVAIGSARQRLKLSAADWHNHAEDMAQVVRQTLFEFRDQTPPYIWGIVRHRLANYALVNVYNRQTGFNSRYSRGYFTNNFADYADSDDDRDPGYIHQVHSKLKYQQPRPVEERLIARETAAEQACFWTQVERELLAILLATGGRYAKPDRLQRYVQILIGRLQGKSNATIALELQLSIQFVTDALGRARERIQAFLATTSVHQGLIRAKGEMMVYWPEAITPAVLNRDRKFVAMLPHGTFTVRYYNEDGVRVGCVQKAVKADGKVRSRMVRLGRVGQITYDRLHTKTLQLHEKVEALRSQAEVVA